VKKEKVNSQEIFDELQAKKASDRGRRRQRAVGGRSIEPALGKITGSHGRNTTKGELWNAQ